MRRPSGPAIILPGDRPKGKRLCGDTTCSGIGRLAVLCLIGISGLPSGTPVGSDLFFQFRGQDYRLRMQ